MKKKQNFLIIIILICTQTYGQFGFIKDAAKVFVAPIPWVGGQVAKQITGNNQISNIINPAPIIIDNTLPSLQKTKNLAIQAVQNGDWYSLSQYTHPWFFQTLTTAKSAKQMGLLNNNECYQLARDIASGLAAKANVSLGDPQAANAYQQWVNTFGNSVCNTTFEGQPTIQPNQISQFGINPNGTISVNGNTYNFQDVYTYQVKPIMSCNDRFNRVENIIGYSDGKLVNPIGMVVGNLQRDPSGNFLFVFGQMVNNGFGNTTNWYGITYRGEVIGPGPQGPQTNWGGCRFYN